MMAEYVTIRELVDALDIKLMYGEEHLERQVTLSEISRPGLVLTGYETDYKSSRLQLLGNTEINYVCRQAPEERRKIYQRVCREDTPAVVVAQNLEIPKELVEVAQEVGIPILSARSKTSRVLANLTNFLEGHLAERMSVHGVLLEMFGIGVMLVGGSGVGKSETALELVQRGHRLIADDRVELFSLDELTLIGEAPEILQNMLELRGVGIVDVMSLYGVAAIRRSKRLEVIIEFIPDDGTIIWDRLGNKEESERFFEVDIPKYKIPVKTGRNLSAIVEAAAVNFRANQLGYNATEMFNQKLKNLIGENTKLQESDDHE